MYSLLRNAPRTDVVLFHAPSFLVAFGIASVFYKFGSFGLECMAFVATWFAIDFVVTKLREAFAPPRNGPDRAA